LHARSVWSARPEKVEAISNLPDEPKIRVDRQKMRRVFINLIKNAVDAMPNGSKITLDCRSH